MTWDMSTRGIARIAHKGSKAMTTPTTPAGLALLDDIAPTLRPWRCPLGDDEHQLYGGLCHCGWSYNRPGEAGRRRVGTPDERQAAVLAIEAAAAAAERKRLLDELIHVTGLAALQAAGEDLTRADLLAVIERLR